MIGKWSLHAKLGANCHTLKLQMIALSGCRYGKRESRKAIIVSLVQADECGVITVCQSTRCRKGKEKWEGERGLSFSASRKVCLHTTPSYTWSLPVHVHFYLTSNPYSTSSLPISISSTYLILKFEHKPLLSTYSLPCSGHFFPPSYLRIFLSAETHHFLAQFTPPTPY